MKVIMFLFNTFAESMLSYRHAFHAGNHADVLKHYVLSLVLAYTTQKDKPYWYIDTHAGAGLYSLSEGYSTKNAEHTEGIDKKPEVVYAKPNRLIIFDAGKYVHAVTQVTQGTRKAIAINLWLTEPMGKQNGAMRIE